MDYFDDLEVCNVSKIRTTRSGTPHVSPVGAIGVMTQGPAILKTERKEELIRTPFLYWSHPGSTGGWKTPPGAVRENIWLVARGRRLERMLDSLDRMNPDSGHLFLKNPEKIVGVLTRMYDVFQRGTHHDLRRMPVLMEELMASIGETCSQSEISDRILSLVQNRADRMANEPGGDHDPHKIARDSGISEEYFRHAFQLYMGCPMHDYLLNQRHMLAVRLLRETDLPVNEIGDRCGYPRARDFSRFFKKRSGISPREFRKQVY